MSHMSHTVLLPDWLRAAWITALCAVAVIHLRHVWVMRGQRRYWHVGHVLMAIGMAYMYLPVSSRSMLLSAMLATYLAAIGLLWALGKWDGHYHAAQPTVATSGDSEGRLRFTASADPPRQAIFWLRASLTTMTAGMAYMLVVM